MRKRKKTQTFCRTQSFVLYIIYTNPGFWFSVKSQCFLVSNLLNQPAIFLVFPAYARNRQDKLDPGRCFKYGSHTPDWCIQSSATATLFFCMRIIGIRWKHFVCFTFLRQKKWRKNTFFGRLASVGILGKEREPGVGKLGWYGNWNMRFERNTLFKIPCVGFLKFFKSDFLLVYWYCSLYAFGKSV